MTKIPFGNDPAKVGRYRAFWDRGEVTRPLVGFSLSGWFPLQEFSASRTWVGQRYLLPEMIDLQTAVEDHVRILCEGEIIDDDLLRGAGPMRAAIPFAYGILGCKLRILPENVLREEQHLAWDEALQVRLDPENPWYRKYLALLIALVERANGQFPVSHNVEPGPTDAHAALRGHNQSIIDLIDEPEKTMQLLRRLGSITRELAKGIWKRIPLFHGGYYNALYSLWAPGPIIRIVEDALAVYSPDLYRKLVQPVDRDLASHFDFSFMHLHSTSLYLLEEILEIEEIRCLQVNRDVSGPPVQDMIPHFCKIQGAKRSLLIRGSFTPDELRLLSDSLDPRGLFLLIMVTSLDEVDTAKVIVGM